MNTKLSPEGYSLLMNLLDKDPKKRFSCAEALHHPWFAKFLNKKIKKNYEANFEPLQVVTKPKKEEKKNDDDDNVALYCRSPVMAKMANYEKPDEMDSPNTFTKKNRPGKKLMMELSNCGKLDLNTNNNKNRKFDDDDDEIYSPQLKPGSPMRSIKGSLEGSGLGNSFKLEKI